MRQRGNKKVRIGIADFDVQKARLMAIARGEHTPAKGEPKVWFTSIESVAQVLSSKNQELLKIIFEAEPESISHLAALSGRSQSNLTRTIKTLQRYGLVRLEASGRRKRPMALASRFELDFGVAAEP